MFDFFFCGVKRQPAVHAFAGQAVRKVAAKLRSDRAQVEQVITWLKEIQTTHGIQVSI